MKTKLKTYEIGLATLALLCVMGLGVLIMFVSGCSVPPVDCGYLYYEPYGEEPNTR